VAIVAGILALGGVSAMAAEKIDSITTPRGDEVDVLKLNAEINEVDGHQITFTDTDTGDVYEAGLGPLLADNYSAGDKVELVGSRAPEDNPRGFTFRVREINGEEVRLPFGKPEWAGQGEGDGTGEGMRGKMRRGMQDGEYGPRFMDEDGDGVCDNAQ